jgi:predicted amidohydrolase YtcJ
MLHALRAGAAIAALLIAGPAFGQTADTVLLNGKIVTLAGAPQEAIAIRDGKVAATGTSDEMRKLAGSATRVIDLGGRTVIPGLTDSHMHAIRAALFYATEVNWIGTHSIPEAMERINAAAKTRPGQWLIVAGGWTPQQFAERRIPTQAEVLAAAPDNPVYIQLFYGSVLLTPAGFAKLNITSDSDIPGYGKIVLGGDGKPTGWITGDNV